MQEFEEQWQRWSQDMINALQEWLQTHPQASLQETGVILDERLSRLETQIMRDVALAIAKVKGFEMASKEQPRCYFFFQAEDGIRDLTVTGVQTCALPI